ncbi:multidrug resistance efflux transporter family protein [Hahella ganghwensis]|uniref:multidrug resistance efflux transporter family protein n=1 Tax=Hahella ganghwensis TaxID=286420 RepID=UPI00036AF0D0|nr:multidrug resistance efflux transporter family protein [Hahella ganghwensis]
MSTLKERFPLTSLPVLIGIGLVSAALFSLTFVINYNISFGDGSWVWTAVLRYMFTIFILLVFIFLSKGRQYFKELLGLFRQHMVFWMIAGTFSCGFFYAGIAFSSEYLRGWVVAATFQLTIIFSPFVLMFMGYKFPLRMLPFSFLVLIGATLVNWTNDIGATNLDFVLLGVLPIVISAIAYPFGNQLANSAKNGGLSYVPVIHSPILNNAFSVVLLLCLGSIPFWLLLVAIFQPGVPGEGQYLQTFIVALFAGVLATSVFIYARNLTSDPVKVVAVDTTQATEVLFALGFELVFVDPRLPTYVQLGGLALVLFGLLGIGLRWERFFMSKLKNTQISQSL